MSDTPFKPLDPGRVDLMDPQEVAYWCDEFGCTETQLSEAVAAVGAHAAAVRDELLSKHVKP